MPEDVARALLSIGAVLGGVLGLCLLLRWLLTGVRRPSGPVESDPVVLAGLEKAGKEAAEAQKKVDNAVQGPNRADDLARLGHGRRRGP